MPATATQQTLTPAQQNALARQLILTQSIDRIQQIATQTIDPSTNQGTFSFQPRNVGLIKGFIVDVIATINNPAGAAADITPFGAANLLDSISFTDLQNNTRINTKGWHLHFINTARAMRPFGIGFAVGANSPVAYGSNYKEISAPASIAAGTSGTVTMRYYVPLAYGQNDLRGAIYGNVVNAQMVLNLQLNANALAIPAADPTGAVYVQAVGGGAPAYFGGISNVTVNVYQHYLDQLPVSSGGPVLPMQDISTAYELKSTQVSGITSNQDFPVSYANFRTFMSTFAVFDNAGVLNPGSDVNYWALESANFTNIWKVSPQENALFSMIANGVDWPTGVAYFSHRQRPINTSQFGNMQLILNSNAADAKAQLLIGYEDFSILNTLNNAGSLPGG